MVTTSIYRYIGLVHCRIHKSFDGAIKTVTVSRNPDGKYFVSVLVDDGKANPESVAVSKAVGIDVGLTHTNFLKSCYRYSCQNKFPSRQRSNDFFSQFF